MLVSVLTWVTVSAPDLNLSADLGLSADPPVLTPDLGLSAGLNLSADLRC